MPPSTQVVQWMVKKFPKPKVDSEWLEGCTQWLEEDQNISSSTNFEEFMERVKAQLLESDLIDSMQAGTGFDENILTMSGHLRGPPVLVQIIAITDISSSACQLDQIRSAREERLLAGEGNEEGEEDGDVEVEGEGPMPKYPRGTLRFQLSDGEMTIQAMEYRRITEFNLGNTPLGFKIQLKGTKFQNGMAMLEPDTVILLGGKQSDLQAKQLEDFKWGLHARLGRPLPRPEETMSNIFAARMEEKLPPTMVPRSPLGDIRLPTIPLPQGNDDIDLEPRRRLPAHSAQPQTLSPSDKKDIKQMRPVIPLPSRNHNTNVGSVNHNEGTRPISMAERATLIHAGPQDMMNKSTTSPYFNDNAVASGTVSNQSQKFRINTAIEALDFNLEPTHGQMTHLLPSPEHLTSETPSNPHYFNFDLLDEVDQENPIHRRATYLEKGKERQQGLEGTSSHKTFMSINDDHSSDDYGMMDDNDFDNPLFLEEIDVLEKAALQHPQKTNITVPHLLSDMVTKSSFEKPLTERSSVSSSQPKKPRQNAPGRGNVVSADVIEIDDSDNEMEELEDKENDPIPTRHVRRRLGHPEIAGASLASSLQTQLSQKGRPTVLATNPEDIIDLSDSD